MNSAQPTEKRLTIGILAHVDAGKTTLSEALLYTAGALRKAGRVDHGDAFLDNDEQERRRGITIFSKQAVFRHGNCLFTLLDTPGHVDFSAETERTLQVLDAAILVISAPDGVQNHTLTLWRLLKSYRIPVILFINKMDQPGTNRTRVLEQLKNTLKAGFLDFGAPLDSSEMQEELALLDEALMERYLEQGTAVSEAEIRLLIQRRQLFPCWFGSALKLIGIEAFLDGLSRFLTEPDHPANFGARVFKISHDEQGARLCWLKVTGGTLPVKAKIPGTEDKADQLRLYSGNRFTLLREAPAGTVLAVTGLNSFRAGDGLGFEHAATLPLLSPVLSYRIVLPEGCDSTEMLPKFRSLEEEEPALHLLWDEHSREIRLQLMGEVQTEILKTLVARRYGISIDFDEAAIAYRETIAAPVEGVGHFEPLRHYAEVHLLMEPGEPGSGLSFHSAVRTDQIARNWQQLILTHLEEKAHPGVLTGSAITDMKITLAAGRAHEKHTEGGDFRQATYRAVRNGLMHADNILLEPWYSFTLRVPQQAVGRALSDLDRMQAEFSIGEEGNVTASDASMENTVITGRLPVAECLNYADTLRGYTRGQGQLELRFLGYFPCHNAEEVIAAQGYSPMQDSQNPADSVFCSHGVSSIIPWDQVRNYMHLPSILKPAPDQSSGDDAPGAPKYPQTQEQREDRFLSIEEIDAIIDRTFFANRRNKNQRLPYGKRRRYAERSHSDYKGTAPSTAAADSPAKGAATQPDRQKAATARQEYLLVDGYNIIFAWEELAALARQNIDSARLALLDILSDYQGYRGTELIVVFDAYRVQGHPEESIDWLNLHLVYTKTAQTADNYIEKFAQAHARKDRVIVATSDGMEQIIVRSAGSELLSATELREDILRLQDQGETQYMTRSEAPKNRPMAETLNQLRNGGTECAP